MNKIVIIIPTLNPSKKLINYVKKLKKNFNKIVVVNDGSDPDLDSIFVDLVEMGVTVYKNHVNLGKGNALKYAFNEILNNDEQCMGVITVDSDGQHSIDDVVACSKALQLNKNKLILGVRNFDSSTVPFKSKFGNKITRFILNFFVGINISDTQTGLRGLTKEQMKLFLSTAGERFEYETNMLIDTKKHGIKIIEVPIETIYIENNSESHFNPIKDSILIYKLFVKYIFFSISSFLIDISLFKIFFTFFLGINSSAPIIIATILSRVISSSYNYIVNSRLVFKNKNKSSILKYYALALFQMFLSGTLVTLVNETVFNTNQSKLIVFIKIIIDIFIFAINFVIQREWVFRQKKL